MAVNRIARAALIFLLMLTMVNMRLLWGQSGTSSGLAGNVLDKSGAAIPRAQVKAIEVNTGSARVVHSNQEGRFLFSQVNPGTYRIEVDAEGIRGRPVAAHGCFRGTDRYGEFHPASRGHLAVG